MITFTFPSQPDDFVAYDADKPTLNQERLAAWMLEILAGMRSCGWRFQQLDEDEQTTTNDAISDALSLCEDWIDSEDGTDDLPPAPIPVPWPPDKQREELILRGIILAIRLISAIVRSIKRLPLPSQGNADIVLKLEDIVGKLDRYNKVFERFGLTVPDLNDSDCRSKIEEAAQLGLNITIDPYPTISYGDT